MHAKRKELKQTNERTSHLKLLPLFSHQTLETSEEFKRLEQETDLRREFTEKVHDSLTTYLKTMGKRKESLTDKSKKLPLESLADAMIHYGTMLHEDSMYG